MTFDVSLIIGGPQGGGIESAGQIALKAFVIKGYNVLGNREYQSNIMGAHSYYHLRVSEERPGSVRLPVDGLIALDAESVFTHMEEVRPGGFIVYDVGTGSQEASKLQPMASALKKRIGEVFESRGLKATVSNAISLMEESGVKAVGLPMKELLKRVADESKRPIASVSKTINTMGLSAALSLTGVEEAVIDEAIRAQFAGKPKVVEPNIIAARVARAYVSEVHGLPERIPDGPHKGRTRMIASGNDLVAMGKVVGGLGFETYYPITPASDEALYLEEHRYFEVDGELREALGLDKASIVVLQPEDELAAVNMAIGASYAGARASTSTSGPGFSLMNEAISLAVEAEVPLLISLWMRAGPSTGMPTRQGQQDLLHALCSGHGDAPKIVLASGDHIDAFYDTIKALNWAERYQTPVIHLLDKYIASSMISLDEWEVDPAGLSIDRGKLVWRVDGEYKRYEITGDGISPRAPLGTATMFLTGLEHTEHGMATEDPVVREEMMWKRMRKFETIESEIGEDERAVLHGDPDAKITIVSWGSTKQIILSALRELEADGVKINFLQIRLFNPFPSKAVRRIAENAEMLIGVEMNALGQMGFLVRAHTGVEIGHYIQKVNGRPLFDVEVVEGVKRILESGERRVIASGGS